MLSIEDLYKIKHSLEELEATAEKFDWGPSQAFAQQRQKEALKIVNRAIKLNKKELPYDTGKRLFKEGKGVSDIWGSVESDADLDEAFRGYDDALKESKK